MQQQSNHFISQYIPVNSNTFRLFNNKPARTVLTLLLACMCYFVRAQSVTGSGSNGTCPASASIMATASGFAEGAVMGYQLFQGSTQVRPATAGQFQSTNVFTSLAAGTYTIKAVDQNSAATATSANVVVSISYVPMGLSNALVDVQCFGTASGQITTAVTGGSGTKSYSISGAVSRPGQPSNVFSGLPVGNYTVAVTDDCNQTQTINSSIALDTLSLNAITPLLGFGITYTTLGNCSSALVVRQQSFAAYNSTGLILNSKDFARFSWKYEYPAGSGNFYGAGGVLNAAAVPLNNVTNFSIPMPAGVTASGRAIQPTNVFVYDACGNSKSYSAAFNYNVNFSVTNCSNVINVVSVVSGANYYQPICLPVNFSFTDNASPFTVFNSQQTSLQQTLTPGLIPGHRYTVTGTDVNNGNVVYSNTNMLAPAAPAQTANFSVVQSTCEANKSTLRIAIRTPSPTIAQTFTITSAPASAGLTLPVSYTVNTIGGFYTLPGTYPDGNYTVQVQTDCNNFSISGLVTGHTVSLNTLATVTNCGSINLTGTASLDTYNLYELIILFGSASNVGLTRAFNGSTSLPFTGLAYGTYNIGIRLKGVTSCIFNSLSVNVPAPSSPIDITAATGYVCNTQPSTTATLIVDAISNLNSSLYYSIDDGATYGAAGVKAFTVAYGTNGEIKVKVKDDCGNIASYSGSLIVPPAAIATANSAADNAIICEGNPVQLSVNIVNATYSWTGPNDFSSTVSNPVMPSFITANNGTYSVIVTTACGVQTSSVSITSTALPTVSVTTGNAATCLNNPVQLSNATTGGSWSSNNPSVATVSNTGLVTGVTAGSTVITYTTAPNGNGCTNTALKNMTIAPIPSGVVTGTASVSTGDAAPLITFTGSNGTAPFTFTYNINGGSPITVNTVSGNSVSVSQPTNSPGTFNYNLVSTHDNGSASCSSTQTASATITVNVALPITLVSFEARMQGAFALLTWTASREINNDYFELERSSNGITFSKIVTVTSIRSLAEKHEYRFLDTSPISGESFYRLKQFDIDKKWTISDIISLHFTGLSVFSVTPNPASGMTKISSLPGRLSLIDMSGKMVLDGIRTTGNYNMNVKGYPGGIYLVRVIQDDGKASVLKLKIQK